MKKMYGLLASLMVLTGFAQNPAWLLNDQYLSPTGLTPVPAGAITINPEYAGNMMMDQNNDPLFFVHDGAVYDKDGNYIEQLTWDKRVAGTIGSTKYLYGAAFDNVPGFSENCIIPDPVNCKKYYVFTAGVPTTQYNTSYVEGSIYDFEMNRFMPFVSHIDVSNYSQGGTLSLEMYPTTNASIVSNAYVYTTDYYNNKELFSPAYSLVTPAKSKGIYWAAAPKVGSGNSAYNYVFMFDGSSVFTYKVDISGVNFVSSSEYFISSANQASRFRAELEVVPISGGYRLAFVYEGSQYEIGIIEYNTSGLPITSTFVHKPVGTSGYPQVHGLEFTPDGSKLVFTNEIGTGVSSRVNYLSAPYSSASVTVVASVPANSDLSKSQIELKNIGGVPYMYFATQNVLMTLNVSSSTPSSWTWNSSAVVSTTSLGPTDVSQNGFEYNANYASFLLPDQVDGMNYATYQQENAACCYFYSNLNIKEPVTLPVGTYTVTNSTPLTCTNTITGAPVSVTFSTNTIATGNITIPNGAKVTFQGLTIKFAPNTGMIVNAATSGQGGKVVLNASSLTWYTDCGESQLWHGVTLNGGATAQGSTSNSPHAVLTTVGVSQIDHALVALNIKGGAIVQYTGGSKLLDNKIAIEAEAYGYAAINDVGVFNNAIIKTQSTFSIVQPTYFARITGRVPTFRFQGCTFDNDQTTYNNLYDGVISIDSKVSLSTGCTLNDLRFAVNHSNITANSGLKLTVNSATFNRNIRGISLSNSNFASINSNTFNILDNSTTIPFAVGLYIDVSSAFVIGNNTFKNQTLGTATLSGGGTIGIVANNTNKLDNTINFISQNTFYNLHEGIQCLNKNFYTYIGTPLNDRGLRMYCNNFSQAIQWCDIGVHSPQGADPSAIDVHQGEVPDIAAGNTFSHYTSIDYFHYTPSTYAVDYKWHAGTTNGKPNLPTGVYPVSEDDLVSNTNCGSGGEGQRIGDVFDPAAVLQEISDLQNAIAVSSGTTNRNDGNADSTLGDDLSSLQAQLDELQTKIVVYYLNDSITPAANDSANKYILAFSADAMKKGNIIDAYLAKGNYKSAANVYGEMASVEAGSNYYIMYGIILELYGKNVANELMSNPSLLNAVNAIANDRSDEAAFVMAQNLLAQIGLRTHIEEVQGFNTASVERNSISKEAEFSVFKLSNFPNPFTGNTTLTAFVPKGSTSASIVITDVLGKVVANYNLTEGNNSVEFDKQELKGILYYSLFVDGQRKETKMMMKQ